MRIAVFHNLPKGGAKRVLYELIKRLSKSNEIDLYTTNEAEKDFLPLDKFVNNKYVVSIDLSENFIRLQKFILKDLPEIHKKVAYNIDSKNYDVVFVNHDFFTKAPYILRFLKTPSLYLCHESPREFYENRSLFSTNMKYKLVNFLRLPLKKADYINARSADVLVTNSNFSKKRLQEIYKRKFKMLKHGVDAGVFKYKKIKRSNYFLTVGALAIFKGHDFLIDAILKLPIRFRFPLVIVADGGRDKSFILKKAKRLSVKIILKKDLSNSNLIDFYNRAKLFLFASHDEPLGLCVLEAMACGCPVVAVSEGGLKEIITNKFQGYLVKRDTDEFAKAINRAMEHDYDEKTIRNYIKKNWSWEKAGSQLDKYFKTICKNSK